MYKNNIVSVDSGHALFSCLSTHDVVAMQAWFGSAWSDSEHSGLARQGLVQRLMCLVQ